MRLSLAAAVRGWLLGIFRICPPAAPCRALKIRLMEQETSRMGIMSLIEKLFELVAPPKAMKLDGTTEATLPRSLSALPPDERGWITFAEARILFSTKGAQ